MTDHADRKGDHDQCIDVVALIQQNIKLLNQVQRFRDMYEKLNEGMSQELKFTDNRDVGGISVCAWTFRFPDLLGEGCTHEESIEDLISQIRNYWQKEIEEKIK